MAKIRIKDGENLTPCNIKRVISLLTQEKPITKKVACEILNISYNTTRLKKILDDFEEQEEYRKLRRKQVRGTPLSTIDTKYIISAYLSSEPLHDIAEATYRSLDIIKEVLHKYNVPLRNSKNDYMHPVFIQDEAISQNYEKDDLVYSARYNAPAYIEKKLEISELHGEIYRIRIVGPLRRLAVQPYYELADLRNLQKELKLVLEEMPDDMIKHTIAQTLYNARKKSKKDDK